MAGPDRSAAPIAASIDLLRRQFGLGRPDSLATLEAQWPELAGEKVSTRSKVIDLRQGTLTVDAYDPANIGTPGHSGLNKSIADGTFW